MDGTERAATKVARNRVGAVKVGIYYADQAYRFALFGEFLIDTGVIAPEGAHADYGGIND